MADAVVNFLVENLLQIIKENAELIGNAKDDFAHLLEEVRSLNAFLQDAAKYQSNSNQWKHFVKEVQVTVYRAEDLIDKFLVQAKLHKEKNILKRGFDFDYAKNVRALASNIKGVLERVKKIREDNQQAFQKTPILAEQQEIVAQESQANEIDDKIRCKHGYLLPLKISWTNQNPGRRYWACPFYGEKSCNFFRWKDGEIDDRSKFVIPKLLDKICELEDKMERYEAKETILQEEVQDELTMKMELECYIDKIKNLECEIEFLKKRPDKENGKKIKSNSRKKIIWFIIVCACIVFLACKVQLIKLKDE